MLLQRRARLANLHHLRVRRLRRRGHDLPLQLAEPAAQVLVVAAEAAATTLLAEPETAPHRFELLHDRIELLLRVRWEVRITRLLLNQLHLRERVLHHLRDLVRFLLQLMQIARGVVPDAAIGVGDLDQRITLDRHIDRLRIAAVHGERGSVSTR